LILVALPRRGMDAAGSARAGRPFGRLRHSRSRRYGAATVGLAMKVVTALLPRALAPSVEASCGGSVAGHLHRCKGGEVVPALFAGKDDDAGPAARAGETENERHLQIDASAG